MLLTRKYDSTVIRPNNFLSSYRSDTEGTVVEKIRSFLPDGAKGEYIKPPARSTFNFSQRLLDATEDHNHSKAHLVSQRVPLCQIDWLPGGQPSCGAKSAPLRLYEAHDSCPLFVPHFRTPVSVECAHSSCVHSRYALFLADLSRLWSPVYLYLCLAIVQPLSSRQASSQNPSLYNAWSPCAAAAVWFWRAEECQRHVY